MLVSLISEIVDVVSHFSAGIGRTGTFVCLDYLYDQGCAEQEVNINRCVKNMRAQRTNLVQTKVLIIV